MYFILFFSLANFLSAFFFYIWQPATRGQLQHLSIIVQELSHGPPLFYSQWYDLVASEKEALIALAANSVGGSTAALLAFVKMRIRSRRRDSGRGFITVLSARKSWQRLSCEIKRWSNKKTKKKQTQWWYKENTIIDQNKRSTDVMFYKNMILLSLRASKRSTLPLLLFSP